MIVCIVGVCISIIGLLVASPSFLFPSFEEEKQKKALRNMKVGTIIAVIGLIPTLIGLAIVLTSTPSA